MSPVALPFGRGRTGIGVRLWRQAVPPSYQVVNVETSKSHCVVITCGLIPGWLEAGGGNRKQPKRVARVQGKQSVLPATQGMSLPSITQLLLLVPAQAPVVMAGVR